MLDDRNVAHNISARIGVYTLAEPRQGRRKLNLAHDEHFAGTKSRDIKLVWNIRDKVCDPNRDIARANIFSQPKQQSG